MVPCFGVIDGADRSCYGENGFVRAAPGFDGVVWRGSCTSSPRRRFDTVSRAVQENLKKR